MTNRVPLFQLMHTPEGDAADAYADLYEAVGVGVSEEIRKAKPAKPRGKNRPHKRGECANGIQNCPAHRQQRIDELVARRDERKRVERDKQARLDEMNRFRMASIHGARVQKPEMAK